MSIPWEEFEILDSNLFAFCEIFFSIDFSTLEVTFSLSLTGFSPLSLKEKSSFTFFFLLTLSFSLFLLDSILFPVFEDFLRESSLLWLRSFLFSALESVKSLRFETSDLELELKILESFFDFSSSDCFIAFSMSIFGVLRVFSKLLSVSSTD